MKKSCIIVLVVFAYGALVYLHCYAAFSKNDHRTIKKEKAICITMSAR